MSTPIVPPRPNRNQDGPSPTKNDTPFIPPRPVRKTDSSPDRDISTRSPLNDLPGASEKLHTTRSRTSQDLPRRPPSVSLPSIGQEGSEYSSYDQLPDEARRVPSSAEQTTSVSPDLPMHQPRASLPQSTAKRQIQTVTRTDSAQAAAAGIGKGPSVEDLHPGATGEPGSPLSRTTSHTQNYHNLHHAHGGKRAPSAERHPLRAKSSFNRSTSSLTPLERNPSRPSSVYGDDHEHGIPVIGQQIPLNPMAGDVQAPSPAPSYSQHTPGIGYFNDGSQRAQARRKGSKQDFGPPGSYGIHHDHDHQDQFEKAWVAKHPEEAAREESYLHLPRPASALTSDQLNKLVGLAAGGKVASAELIGATDEDVAFETPTEHASSPRKPSTDRTKRNSTGDHHRRSLSGAGYKLGDEYDHAYMVAASASAETGLGPHGSHEGGWDAPILAADEVIKRPGSAYMHAAVAPEPQDDSYDSDHSRRNSVQPPSRPSSRPSSVHGGYHGGPLHRYVSHEEPHHSGPHTPLAEIEEYEPLFPEDEKAEEKPRAFKKRPELAMHHFPSQDVWEDTPASLQYSATVTTPDLERRDEFVDAGTAAAVFETPDDEERRRSQNPNDMTSDRKTLLKPHFKPGVLEEVRHERPGVQRFPSSDVWEDSPDSVYLETTVNAPQMDETLSRPEDRPTTGALETDDDDTRATTGLTGAPPPHVPSRPERKSKADQEMKSSSEEAAASGRTKPTIPARPVRSARPQQADEGNNAVPLPKTKPAVPARPGGEKIAAMKAGFMNDLNNRLRLGPQAPPAKKEPEPEADEETQRAPLADARKTRARGPTRRKPGTSAVAEFKSSTFAMSPLITVWSIDEEDELQVQPDKPGDKTPSVQETERALAANEAVNTQEPTFAAPRNTVSTAGAEGDVPDPSISTAAVSEQQSIASTLETALKQSEPAPKSFEAREKQDLETAATQPSVSVTASSGTQE